MTATLEQIATFLKYQDTNHEGIIKKYKKDLKKQQDKDENPLPIYSIKDRIKKKDSVFLKTKRDDCSLEDINDYVGLRILCLFEQDIFTVHDYLIRNFEDLDTEVYEFKIFNWKDEDKKNILVNNIKRYHKKVKYRPSDKATGYKSIHYLCSTKIGKKKYLFEIQLRTLLQDVWGELEHALSYKKGEIHPYIKNSFRLLAKDLESNDELVTHLKEISEIEKIAEKRSIKRGGPIGFFDYEDKLKPSVFNYSMIKPLYDEYIDFIKKQNPRSLDKKWIEEARSKYDTILNNLNEKQKKQKKVKYFINMENAFLFFCDGGSKNYDAALKIYEEMEKNSHVYYCLYFRKGEIFFILGEIEKALDAFDKSDTLLTDTTSFNALNKFRIKTKLAYIYWFLGKEYNKYSVDYVTQAEKIYDEYKDTFEDKEDIYKRITNSSCYYRLEQYLILKNKINELERAHKSKDQRKKINEVKRVLIECEKELEERLNILEQFIKNKNASSHIYDTVSWYYYNQYLEKRLKRDLLKAKAYCEEITSAKNYATYGYLSRRLHERHIYEILWAAEDKKIGSL